MGRGLVGGSSSGLSSIHLRGTPLTMDHLSAMRTFCGAGAVRHSMAYSDDSNDLTKGAGGWASDSNNATHDTESVKVESLNIDVDTANEPILPSPPIPAMAPRPVDVMSEVPQLWSWASGHKNTSFFLLLQQLSPARPWSWATGHKNTSFYRRLQQFSPAQRWSWSAGHKTSSFCRRLQQLCRRDLS